MNKKLIACLFIFNAIVFFSYFALGLLINAIFPEAGKYVTEILMDKFGPLRDAPQLSVLSYIFINNLSINFLLIAGFFLFGLMPLVILLSNGLVTGLVIGFAFTFDSAQTILYSLLPHGVIEIPVFLYSASVSLWLTWQLIKKIFFGQPFRPSLVIALKKFVFIILPLTLVAALIETFITPLVVSRFG